MVGRIMEAGYAYSESAVLLCNTWDLVVLEGSGDVSLGHRQLGANDWRPKGRSNEAGSAGKTQSTYCIFWFLRLKIFGAPSVLRPIFYLKKFFVGLNICNYLFLIYASFLEKKTILNSKYIKQKN